MVASPHVLASASGVAALRAGGNALDAAIAAAATIAVVYPHMNGLGGDNVWLIHDAGRGGLRALRGLGRSARAASIAWYAARGIDGAIPVARGRGRSDGAGRGGRLVVGPRVQPRDHGLAARLARPAGRRGRLCARGLLGLRRTAHSATAGAGPLRARGLARHQAGSRPLYHPDALARGPLIQTDLARTIEAVAAGGPEAFYRGDVGRRIVAAASAAGSPLAIEDFAEHRSEWVEPLTIRYGGGVAASFPPPTQGMSALAMLGISEAFDMAALPEADYVHVLVEAAKLAFADRDRHLTDPAVMRVSPEELLAPERLKRLAGKISRRRAMSPGDAAAAAGDTIAITTADRAGNAVSLIQSLYFTWGSALVAGDTGVVLQNRGSFFSLDPASSNALVPGKLTMHTLAPSMYLEDGRARFAYGTMGGEGQPQTQAALVTRRLHRGLGPQAAVEAPRWLFGRTWGTPSRALNLEERYPSDLARDLAARGHDVKVGEAWDDLFGHAQCVWLSPDGEGLLGGSDPRADGAALGF